jgi:hypothetical protein
MLGGNDSSGGKIGLVYPTATMKKVINIPQSIPQEIILFIASSSQLSVVEKTIYQ